MATSPEHTHASEHDPLSTHSRVPLARARAHSAPEPAAGASCAAERAAACTAAQEVKKVVHAHADEDRDQRAEEDRIEHAEEEGTPRIAHGDLRDRRAGGPRAEALDPGRNLRPAM